MRIGSPARIRGVSMCEERFASGEGGGDLAGLRVEPELTGNLSRGEQATHSLHYAGPAVCGELFVESRLVHLNVDHDGVLAANLLERRQHMSDFCSAHLVHVDRFQMIASCHDLANRDLLS